MKSKNILILGIIFLIVFTNNSFSFAMGSNSVLISSPEEVKRIEEFLKNNDDFLSERDKQLFIEIRNKLQRYEGISQEEIDYMRQCERDIIRTKLGEAIFEEYSKLIKKRATNSEFTPPERFRLLEIEKMLREKK